MKKVVMLLFITALILPVACKKKVGTSVEAGDVLAKKYARYGVQVFKDETCKENLAWLTKGEEVNLLEEKPGTINNKNVTLAKVQLADDKVGFADADGLCIKFVVFNEDKVKVYQRNTDTSKVSGEAMLGAIADVREEKADWIKVNVRSTDSKMLWNVWAKKGFSIDADMLSDGKILDNALNILEKEKSVEKDKEQAKKDIQDLIDKNNFISPTAQKILGKYSEVKTQETQDNTATDSAQ